MKLLLVYFSFLGKGIIDVVYKLKIVKEISIKDFFHIKLFRISNTLFNLLYFQKYFLIRLNT